MIVLNNNLELINYLGISEEQFDTALNWCQKPDGLKYGYSYKTVYIPKRNGKQRRLDIPGNKLKAIQQKLLPLLQAFPVNPAAAGFMAQQSAATVAKKFSNWKTIIALDLQDFFPNSSAMAWYQILKEHYPESIAKAIARLTTFRGGLPQGAPTSPTISNILATPIDDAVSTVVDALTIKHLYIRYADDLIIALDTDDKKVHTKLVKDIAAIVSKNGHKLNTKKTKIMVRPDQQTVLGITVSTKTPTVNFKLYRATRAATNNFIRHGMLPMKSVTPEVEVEKLQSTWYEIAKIPKINLPPRPFTWSPATIKKYSELQITGETNNEAAVREAVLGFEILSTAAELPFRVTELAIIYEKNKDLNTATADEIAKYYPYVLDMMRPVYQYFKERATPWKRALFNYDVENKIYKDLGILQNFNAIPEDLTFFVDSSIRGATLNSTTITASIPFNHSLPKFKYATSTFKRYAAWLNTLWIKACQAIQKANSNEKTKAVKIWYTQIGDPFMAPKNAIRHPLMVLPQYYPVLLAVTLVQMLQNPEISVQDKGDYYFYIIAQYRNLMRSTRRGLLGKVNWINQVNTEQGDALVAMMKSTTQYTAGTPKLTANGTIIVEPAY